ncbi:MAG TPA: energy transducer TonB [Bacteroidia bacterium]|jgi:TonB family protein|nr:energy transducer TonB [Bacteroidia bacterium]
MKKLLILLLITYPLSLVYAQDNTKSANTPATMEGDVNDPNHIYGLVSQMPEFDGDLYKYLGDHLAYPEAAMDKGVQGTVYVTFVVEKDGNLTGVHVIHSLEHSLDSAAVACIRRMPKWKAGIQNGLTVRVQYNLPIKYTMPLIDTKSVNPTTPPRVK